MDKKGLTLNGLAVRYYEAGAGPPLLLLHGAGATARLWRRQFGPFSGRFRVVAPDLPGFGGSDASPDIKEVCDYARFVSGFLDALQAGRASLVGSSMGGWAACCFAAGHPGRVEKLVLVSPAGAYMPEAPPMPVEKVMEEVERLYTGQSPAQGGGAGGANDELEKAKMTVAGLSRSGGFRPDIEEILPAIKAETLILWGEEDKIIPPVYKNLFTILISGSIVTTIGGAGHMPYVERPLEFNKAVMDFLVR